MIFLSVFCFLTRKRYFYAVLDFKASFWIKDSFRNLIKALRTLYTQTYVHAHMPTYKFCMQFKGVHQPHYNECTPRYCPGSSYTYELQMTKLSHNNDTTSYVYITLQFDVLLKLLTSAIGLDFKDIKRADFYLSLKTHKTEDIKSSMNKGRRQVTETTISP